MIDNQVQAVTDVIQWCSICNSRPFDGMLQVVVHEDNSLLNLRACNQCVQDIPDDEWLENQDLKV